MVGGAGMVLLFLSTPTSASAADEPPLDIVEPQLALQAFIDTCWRGIRDREIFDDATRALAEPLRRSAEDRIVRLRSAHWQYYYSPGITCVLSFRVGTTPEAMRIADQLAEHLGLRATERYWAADASPALALWQFRHVPVDRSYYALWVRARQPRRFDAQGPSEVEISVSFGFAR